MYYTILRGSDKGNMTYSFSVSVIEKGIHFQEASDYFARDDDSGMEMSRSLLIPSTSFDALLRLLMKRCQLELSLSERFEEKCLLLKNLLAQLDASSEFYKPGRGSGGANLGLLRRWLEEEGIPSESSQWVY